MLHYRAELTTSLTPSSFTYISALIWGPSSHRREEQCWGWVECRAVEKEKRQSDGFWISTAWDRTQSCKKAQPDQQPWWNEVLACSALTGSDCDISTFTSTQTLKVRSVRISVVFVWMGGQNADYKSINKHVEKSLRESFKDGDIKRKKTSSGASSWRILGIVSDSGEVLIYRE